MNKLLPFWYNCSYHQLNSIYGPYTVIWSKYENSIHLLPKPLDQWPCSSRYYNFKNNYQIETMAEIVFGKKKSNKNGD